MDELIRQSLIPFDFYCFKFLKSLLMFILSDRYFLSLVGLFEHCINECYQNIVKCYSKCNLWCATNISGSALSKRNAAKLYISLFHLNVSLISIVSIVVQHYLERIEIKGDHL